MAQLISPRKKDTSFRSTSSSSPLKRIARCSTGLTEFQEYLDVDEKCQEYAYVRPAEILERSHFRQERRNGEYTAERSDCSIGCFLFSDDIDGESGRMD